MPDGLLRVIGLLCLGWGLLAIEVLVPGGVVGILGGLVLAWACWAAFDLGPMWGMGAVAASIAATAGTLALLSRSRVAARLILDDPSPAGWHAAPQELADLLGRRGVTATTLRPAGTVVLGDARVDVVTAAGEFIGRGVPVEVVAVEGVRVVVAAVPSPTNSAAEA